MITPENIVSFIRKIFNSSEFIPLHAPQFLGNEKKYVNDAIDSTFVSSVGKYVEEFEKKICEYTNSKFAIATVNGTSALHISLLVAGVNSKDLVITQPLSFIATCNAISYIGAEPLFIDIDPNTLGLSHEALNDFLKHETKIINGECFHIKSNRRISACVPMHTFGHPVKLNEIQEICSAYSITLIEDAAESLGSFYNSKHTGTIGKLGVFSFNGNKTITSGGGGVIITNDHEYSKVAKHLTTQAKVSHRWNFVHDSIGYNYRMPNINAALACGQLEMIEKFIEGKRKLSEEYRKFFLESEYKFIEEPINCRSNYWLNCIIVKNTEERDYLLEFFNDRNIMTRPVWTLLNKLSMFKDCIVSEINEAEKIESRLINLPSSYLNTLN